MAPPNVVKSINVSYPSLAPIFTYSKLEDRRRMAKWIPALRVTQKTAPFIFETVSLSSKDRINYHIQFDDLIWRFQTENNRPWTETSKMNHVNENGYVLESNLIYKNMNNIVRYFLKRRTLRIKNFLTDGWYQLWPHFHTIPYIENLRISQKAFVEKCLESFWNTKVGSLELHQDSFQNMAEQLSKIKCDDVKIYFCYCVRFHAYVSLPFKKLQIFENLLDVDRFCDFVKKFREGRHEEGSAYTGRYTVNAYWLWARLKARYPLKTEHENFLIISTDNPDRDLLVERRGEPPYSCCEHSVKVVESSSEELKRIKSVYRRRALPKQLCWLAHIILFILFLLFLALPFYYACYYSFDRRKVYCFRRPPAPSGAISRSLRLPPSHSPSAYTHVDLRNGPRPSAQQSHSSAMAPPHPVQSINVSYLSLVPIFIYSKLEDRKRMAKWIPALTAPQKTAPFIFETVSLSSEDDLNYHIQFDGVIWRFRSQKKRPWTQNSKMCLVNEEGNVLKSNLTIANVINIVRHFLKGRTLRIKNFRVDGYYQVWPELLTTIPIIENLRISQKKCLRRCLESFWNTKVGSLELHQYCFQNMTEQLSKIECDDVKISLSDAFDVSYVSLPFKKLKISERNQNIDRFFDFVEKFRAGRHEEGSAYTGLYKWNTDEVWARLKNQYPLKIEDENFLIIATDNPDRDLLVERREDNAYRYYGYEHSVKVVDKSSQELKRIKSISRRRALLFSLLVIFFNVTLTIAFAYDTTCVDRKGCGKQSPTAPSA